METCAVYPSWVAYLEGCWRQRLNHLSTQTRGPKSQEFFRKVFRTMRYVQKSCQTWGSKNFSVFSNLALTFHLRMLSVNGVQNSISQPILHPKRGSCLLLASWIPLEKVAHERHDCEELDQVRSVVSVLPVAPRHRQRRTCLHQLQYTSHPRLYTGLILQCQQSMYRSHPSRQY